MFKRKFMYGLLVLLWMSYIAVFASCFLQYQQWVNDKLASYPEEVKPYVDFTPFQVTTVGTALLLTGVFLTVFCVSVVKGSRVLSCFLAAVLAYIAVMATVSVVFGETLAMETVRINVFLVWDEEVYSDSNLRFSAQQAVNVMKDVYYYEFQSGFDLIIDFDFSQWYLWDSSDAVHDTYDLLQEAMVEMGWTWGKVVDGKARHIMVVASANAMDQDGLSPPEWKALIFKVDGSYFDTNYRLLHEMGHQFGCNHCWYPFCYMSLAYLGIGYCRWHERTISDNRYLPLTPPTPSTNPKRGGGGRWHFYMT